MTPEGPLNFKVTQNNQVYFNELKSLVHSALVEKFQDGYDRPYNESDFSATKQNRDKITSEIRVLIQKFVKDSVYNQNIDNEILASVLILCGQNTSLQPWNTETTVKNCQIILNETIKLLKCENPPEIISKNCKINLVKVLFQMICHDLTSESWKHFPATVACYTWILEMIKQPNLSQYLQFVFPPALLLTDDFVTENKIKGIKCLNHIIQNITIAELQFCGYGNVIYSVLLPLLKIRESVVLSSIMSPLIFLTAKLEVDLGKKDITKWSKFDDILESYLENMELEQLIDLRYFYISNLGFLINASGFGIIKWSKRLLRIFREYILTARNYNDEKTINLCIQAIQKYIEFSSESNTLYVGNLLVTLMFAVNHISHTELQKKSKEIAVMCVGTLLKSVCKSDREQLKQIFSEKFSLNLNTEIY